MKILPILLLTLTSASAEVFTGDGTFSMPGTPSSVFTFTLKYEASSPPAKEGQKLGLPAVQGVGTIKIAFDENRKLAFEYPFFVTQLPDKKGHSLVGFYLTDGYPHVLTIDTWKSERPFLLYESFRSRGTVLTGTVRE